MAYPRSDRPSRFLAGWPTFLITAFLLLAFTGPAQGISVTRGDVAPDFTAETLDGKSVSLSDFRGGVVFVAFWSSWCSRCKEEIDYLKDLKARYPEVTFLGINAESEEPDAETTQRMEQAVEDWEIPFTVLIDRGLRIWDLYQVNALPTSFIVGGDGTIAFAEPNFYFASPDNIENAMRALLNEKLQVSRRSLVPE